MKKGSFDLEAHYLTAIQQSWLRVPAKVFLHEIDVRTETGAEDVLGLSGARGVLKRSEMRQRSSEAASYVGYKKVSSGQLISNKMQAWNGIFGISSYDGITSPDYAVYEIGSNQDPRFIEYTIRTKLYSAEFLCRSKGIGTGFLRLNPRDFLSTPFWLPDRELQTTIADFLDLETTLIDNLIGKKKQFLYTEALHISSLVDKAVSDPNVPRIRFENVVHRMHRPVDLSKHEELVRLGLYNRGRGIFKKPTTDEDGMGDSNFIFVEAGDLILSGQFAWEGAVALVTDNEKGCVVSHRYPVYRARKGINTPYLLGLLRSGYGDFLLNESSRGSAGRNRPLNTWRLGKEKIPIPNAPLQETVERAVHFERWLSDKTKQSIAGLTELRSALITAVVTGQIDVTTWSKRGETDRRLDELEQAGEHG